MVSQLLRRVNQRDKERSRNTMQRPKRAESNHYHTPQDRDGTYEEIHVYSNPSNELGISGLDLAAFTVNSSVYKNTEKRQDRDDKERTIEPFSYIDAVGKESLTTSRKIKWLVVLNAILSVLTLLCLGLTSFVCYKVIIKREECCRSYESHPTGYPTVMPSVDWTTLSKSVQSLQQNLSIMEILMNLERNLLHESVSKISRNLTELREDINRTRQNVAKEISSNLTELREEIHRTRQNVAKEEQAIASLNLTSLKPEDLSELWRRVNSSRTDIHDVREKLANLSKVAPPRGPPGYNGTQGPPGGPGPNGQRGPPGPGNNITQCKYKFNASAGAPFGSYATQDIAVTEQQGTKIVGVHCDTNDAKVCRLHFDSKGPTYTCKCKDTLSTGQQNMYCFIHYWECQINT